MKQPTNNAHVKIITGCLLSIACGLALVFYLRANQPASNAVMAMASGQYTLASRFYAADAVEGNPAAMNSLANLYYLGLGIEKDYRRAAELYHEGSRCGACRCSIESGAPVQTGPGCKHRSFTCIWLVQHVEHPWQPTSRTPPGPHCVGVRHNAESDLRSSGKMGAP